MTTSPNDVPIDGDALKKSNVSRRIMRLLTNCFTPLLIASCLYYSWANVVFG